MSTAQAVKRTFKPQGPLETAYVRGRQEWDSRLGTATVQAKNWRYAFFSCIAVAGLLVLGLIYVGTRPKLLPHIIVVDQLGAAQYRGPVDPNGDWNPGEAAIKYHLRRFLSNTREISSDLAIVRRNWTEAYTQVTRNGAAMLTGYVGEHDPFKRAQEERVTIEVLSMVRATSKTWEVNWRETTFDKNGNALTVQTWRGLFQTFLKRPTTEEELAKNPIGLFIEEFSWDRVKG